MFINYITFYYSIILNYWFKYYFFILSTLNYIILYLFYKIVIPTYILLFAFIVNSIRYISNKLHAIRYIFYLLFDYFTACLYYITYYIIFINYITFNITFNFITYYVFKSIISSNYTRHTHILLFILMINSFYNIMIFTHIIRYMFYICISHYIFFKLYNFISLLSYVLLYRITGILTFSLYSNLLNKGSRIALRGKVNDTMSTGLLIVDSCLPIGRGQRQLILGDRYTGKTSIFISSIITSNFTSNLTINGFGTKRLYSIYVAININLSKLLSIIDSIFNSNSQHNTLILSTQSSTNSLLSFLLPNLGINIAETLRNIGIDTLICFDDLSKHSKAYRQISLLSSIIPSRDAFPSNIFNIHSSLLERSGKLSSKLLSSSITAFPIIETINSNITEFIATNVISITDGQLYLSRNLFLSSIRPAIDTALSVSRIGSSAQSKFIKLLSSGLKNEITTLRLQSELNNIQQSKLNILTNITCQDHLFIYLNYTQILLLLSLYSNINLSTTYSLYTFLYYLSNHLFYLSYITFISSNNYNSTIYQFILLYIQYYNGFSLLLRNSTMH